MDEAGLFDGPDGLEEADALELRVESECDSTPLEPLTAAEIDQLAGPIARFGMARREEWIFGAIYVEGRSPWEVAREHYLAPRTVQNIARGTMRRLAQRQKEWDSLSRLELIAEYERLEKLWQLAAEAYQDYLQDRIRGRQRFRAFRYLYIAERITAVLVPLKNEIVMRSEAAARRHVRTVPKRAFRRKRLGGRGLRLPRFVVRAASELMRAAACDLKWPLAWRMRGVFRTGIPPPADARGSSWEQQPIATALSARLRHSCQRSFPWTPL